MKIFDILNGYKMDGRKRPIRRGFGLLSGFVYKSRSCADILTRKKRCCSDNVCQNQFKNADDSMFQSGVKSDKSCAFATGSCTHPEQGRGMVEMLGVLAVIGILSITGILGYRYAMNKSRANDVLNYVRIGHTIISAMKGVPTKATPNDLEELKYPSTDLPYYYGDETAFYIGMPAIEKGVCKLIPDMIASPIIGVYTIEGEVLTADKCTDNIELEYAFEWGDNQELECLLDCGDHGKPDSKCLTCDCMSHFAGDYCDECAGGWQTEEGSAIQCGECPEPFTQQGDTCGCTVQQCDTFNTTTDCSCAKCSTEFNYELKQPVNENGDECVPDEEGGACGWLCEAKEGNLCSVNFENSEPDLVELKPEYCSFTYQNEAPDLVELKPEYCSFIYQNEAPDLVEVKPEYCSFAYRNPAPNLVELKPEYCSFTYQNPDTSDGKTGTLNIQTACPNGKYCYPRWTDKSCGSMNIEAELADGTTIYGTCHAQTEFTPVCSYGQRASIGDLVIQETCPSGKYCYPQWTDKSCGSVGVEDNPVDDSIIYGTCHEQTEFTAVCSYGQRSSIGDLVIQETCPSGKYCYPRWTDKSCGSVSVEDNPADGSIIYGACYAQTEFTAVCSYGQRSSIGDLVIQETCPSGKYCYPRWTDKSCGSVSVEDNPADGSIIYGACYAQTEFTAVCSYGQRATEPTTWPEKKCPRGQYCYPKWTKADCSDAVQDNSVGELFGRCAKQTQFNVSSICPVQQ